MGTLKNLFRLLSLAGKYRFLTYTSIGLSSVSALLALVPFLYIWKIVKEVLENSPAFRESPIIILYAKIALFFAILSFLVYILSLFCSHLAAFRIAANLRTRLMRHIVKSVQKEIDSFGSGRLRKIVNESSGATETFLAHHVPDMATALTTPLGLFVLLFIFDWRLGILSLIPVCLSFLSISFMTGPTLRKNMAEYQNALDLMSNQAVEYIRGVPVVKTFGQTVFSFNKFKKSIDSYYDFVVKYTKLSRRPWLFYLVAINSIFAFIIAGGLWLAQSGIDNQLILNLTFYIIITPIIPVTLAKTLYMSEESMVINDALTRIDQVLGLEEFKEPQNPQRPMAASVELIDISFSYDGQKKAIKNLSLKVEPGQKVALVGPSGSGKTTLASLIARQLDPQSGQVLIGGIDVRQIAKEELTNFVSFVFQNSHLIKASVLDNVRLGRPLATTDEVRQALSTAQCDDIIEKLPDGLETIIGSKGIHLSGGEQQRLAIARSALRQAKIIILDEATAFADAENETKVQAAFSELAKEATVIMIAHRLSTIVSADRIFVLDDGHLVESGPCSQLEANGGLFSRMWKEYQTSVKWKVSREK
ncbi:MAG: ABC transporter ATP-binding protein/permease [Deltaproteobacteria bacterium]|jgi:ATP-binding cassette subfamily B protein|nr:ABC transporter ATP-binding protein/permease [Deltaproteobacteria bacterium]